MICIPASPSPRTPSRLPFATLVWIVALALVLLSAAAASVPALAQQSGAPVDPSLYSGMRWRLIGPYRAGRVTAVAGIPGDAAIYYMGTPGGGIWKTTDGGRIWNPISEDVKTASIGALVLAPSDPNILYAGTGEQTDGDGVYKSTDAGATWTNIGLKDTKYISSLLVDPRDPNIVLAGSLGQPIFGEKSRSKARGVYKSKDGGKTWDRVLFKNDEMGVSDMCMDPGDHRVIYAALWRAGYAFERTKGEGPDSIIYKSTDEGSTWKPVGVSGLPAGDIGRVGLAVAPGDHGRRVFAIIDQGLFRSDDAGSSWRQITTDTRVIGSDYFSRVFVSPRNADDVFVMQTSAYRSSDGGKTFDAWTGAPSGDDFHVLWIDPENSQRMILGVDQGSIISVDGGKTWSSWYNQPTGQFYHVTTDNSFPYIAYAPQQDSGTVAVPNRSDFGEISFRDWFSSGGFEFCYIAPDPANPNIVYSGGWYGSVVRFDKITGQITHVFVRTGKYRTTQMAPLIFSPQDPHTLYLGTQYVLKTTNEGVSWQEISPDLTTRPEKPGEMKRAAARAAQNNLSGQEPAQLFNVRYSPAKMEIPRNPRTETLRRNSEPDARGDERDDEKEGPEQAGGHHPALTTLAPSSAQAGVIWAGTSNGVIQVTQDGGANWKNVSPEGLTEDDVISTIESSGHDANEAYATVIREWKTTPLIYRTRDAGKTWQEITQGLQPGWIARVVREDPVRKGLLYAGTENAVYVSFDDGDYWESLQLNLPTATVRDLAVHGDDLVAATYGRGLYILDDVSPLRQASPAIAESAAYLLRPADAIRVRWDNSQETPLPIEVPTGENPPDGAILDYFLKSAPATGELTIEIRDTQGKLVRRFTSKAPPPLGNAIANVPEYWFESPTVLTKNAGLNRFVWDLRYEAPPALPYSYYGNLLAYVEYTLSDHAIPHKTPREQPVGALVVPGQYEIVFIGNGQLMKQPLRVTLDPRVHVAAADLAEQLTAQRKMDSGMKVSFNEFMATAALRKALADRQKSLAVNGGAKDASDAVASLITQLEAIAQGTREAPGIGPVNRDLARTHWMVGSGDGAPTETARAVAEESCATLNKDMDGWRELNAKSVPTVNALLEKYKLEPLPIASPAAGDACQP